MDIKSQIADLTGRLLLARHAYYKDNSPIMPDADYDALERELTELVAANPAFASIADPVLQNVGSDLVDEYGRYRHAQPMLSIENQYTQADLLAWYMKLPPNVAVCLEPKFDGISVSLTYKGGKLVRALTRGTGTAGEDILKQVEAVASIPKSWNLLADNRLSGTVEIRGELVMRNSTLERLNKESAVVGGKQYTSTRNLTGGTMKQKDISVIPDREILIMPWDVLGDDSSLPDSGAERLKLIAEAGFPEPINTLAKDGVEVAVALALRLKDRIDVLKNKLSLETDGVVIKVDSHKVRRKLGVARKYTNYQTCFKPQSASGTTYLREIAWQVGRTGVISPVANCEVVVLAGAKVTNASLNNITFIRKMGLKLNAKVEMLRSGDVIPQIVRVLDEGDTEIVPPTACPECSSAVVEIDEGGEGIMQQFCTNAACPAVARKTLEFIGARGVLEIDGLGPEYARKLVDGNYARNLGELFEFQAEMAKALETFGEEKFIKTVRAQGFDANLPKLIRSMEKAKTAPWERWIKALCIPMIGETMGRLVADKLGLEKEDMKDLGAKLLFFTTQDVEGFGPAKRQAIDEFVQSGKLNYTTKLFDLGVRPAPVEKVQVVAGAPLAGTVFCITGDIEEDRKSLYKKLESLGAVGKTSVSKKCTLLIVLPGAGKNKIADANKHGIKQVGQEWLVNTFKDNGLTLDMGIAEAV